MKEILARFLLKYRGINIRVRSVTVHDHLLSDESEFDSQQILRGFKSLYPRIAFLELGSSRIGGTRQTYLLLTYPNSNFHIPSAVSSLPVSLFSLLDL